MMFRELMRKHKQLSHEDCIRILKTEKRGVLSVTGDDGYPYGMPMNHYYCDDDGALYFHCGKQSGHRKDALTRCDKVSFCVYDGGTCREGEWALRINSVIVFGTIEMITDRDVVVDIAHRLSRKFTSDEEYISRETERYAEATMILRLKPLHVCGKTVEES